ncbi:outer membrane immunogenic protein [Aminobacter aminovorans]|uniref:Outer membrane protein A n=1 Tax=Aminobacter aminovorans TaxID=83263 RepID=A0A380WRQ0_AMIAI|nr:outer membrane protein [Aminobacter aminovorans]TCS29965.1 outer membrane immunogenic protein [Aminobacter aminovorans]SUU90814.1 outer membrane protein A [Aminobacter aminovorans]
MKNFLVATSFLVAFAGSARAADVVVEEAAPILPAGFVWTGGYVGIQAGWQWGRDHTEEFIGGVATGFDEDLDSDGFIGGVHAGYNWQSGQVVYGIEGDFEFAAVDGGYRLDNDNGTDFDMNWQASIRGRLGFVPMERLLVYGTVGAAFANLEYTYVSAGTTFESFDETKVGWTAGAGIEYAVTDNITTRLEYRYTDFGSVSNLSSVAFPGFTYDHDPQFHAVRVGLSYKF